MTIFVGNGNLSPEYFAMRTSVKIFAALLWPFQRLPLGFHYAWGRLFSWLMDSVLRYRKDVVTVNLSRSFPEKKWKEIRQMRKDFYRHFGDIIAEAIWFGGFRGDEEGLRRSGVVKVVNPEMIEDLYKDERSIMVLTSHLGNWELTGGFIPYMPEDCPVKQKDIIVVYKKLKSQFWDEFIRLNRCAVMDDDFEGYQESHDVLRYSLKHRNEKHLYVFPTDQYPYSGATKHAIPEFLHQPTQAMTGGAALANKLHMSVLYYAMKRVGKGRFEIEFTKICDDAATMSPEEIMVEFYRCLEADIVADPGNYLWSHNRWK